MLWKELCRILENQNREIKVCLTLCVVMTKYNSEEDIEEDRDIFLTHGAIALQNTNILALRDYFNKHIDDFTNLSSGYTLKCIKYFDVHICNYHSLPKLKGHGYFKVSEELGNKKAIINVQNADNKCFIYAILSILHYNDINKDRQRATKYTQWLNDINIEGLEFPFKVCIS